MTQYMPIAFDHIQSFWTTSLRRISPEVLAPFFLSHDTISLLTEIGLPADTSKYLRHAVEVNFYFSEKQIAAKNYQGTRYCVIGDDFETSFAISPIDNSLYSIDFNEELRDPKSFVNTSIWQFLECLQIFSEFQQAALEGEDERQLVEKMTEKFRAVDPNCLGQPTNWWSIVSNQPY